MRDVGGDRLARALAEQRPDHQELLGIALALGKGAVPVRSPAFQSAWRAWRRSVEARGGPGGRRETASSFASESGGASVEENPEPTGSADGGPSMDVQGEGTRPVEREDVPDERDLSSLSVAGPDAEGSDRRKETEPAARGGDGGESRGGTPDTAIDRAGNEASRSDELETAPSAGEEGHRWDGPYTATELGGVLYLVNVLDALDLPKAAQTPPVGTHVGGWAVLEALARALLGPNSDALRPHDPLWRVLATLDGRSPDRPAGQALGEVETVPEAYRMPRAWLEAPHVTGKVDGQWSIENDRLRVWTRLGCVLDAEATSDPAEQAEAEWTDLPNAGVLERAESADAVPQAVEPDHCSPLLARWAARTAPYLRYRLAAALSTDREDGGWLVDVLSQAGKIYTTATHVDLVLPLEAARTDGRMAGLDRSPGWWADGGRTVRFHFREEDA